MGEENFAQKDAKEAKEAAVAPERGFAFLASLGAN
jgi:hypothetical protein